ncbi:MAG: energy transducer TonB [Myxococcota bacterium]
MWLGWVAPAGAGEEAGPFAVEADGLRFEVTRTVAPADARLDEDRRTCRVALSVGPGGVSAAERGCPEGVTADVMRAVSAWEVAGPAHSPMTLGELWFVYPFEQAGPPRVLVRQQHDRRWTLPADVDPVPYQIRAWSFLRYPAGAHASGRADVSCEVEVWADAEGFTTNVQVGGCEAPYVEAARDAVADWRFEPPLVDGSPIPSALVLSTTFVAEDPTEDPTRPGERSQQLWAERQFDALSREERLWFIKAALLGPEVRDLGPGQVRVALPPPVDTNGRELPAYFDDESRVQRPVRDLPDHPPLMVLGRPDHLAIEVYEVVPPAVPDGVGAVVCPLVVQVDGRRRVFAWPEAGCAPEHRLFAVKAAEQWLVRHLGAEDENVRARFRAELVVGAAGVEWVLPADELRSPLTQAPAGVHTARAARPIARVPPRLPKGTPLPSGACTLTATVGRGGRTTDAVVSSCPEGFERSAVRAVRRWQWDPAERDGVPIESEVPVTIRFAP